MLTLECGLVVTHHCWWPDHEGVNTSLQPLAHLYQNNLHLLFCKNGFYAQRAFLKGKCRLWQPCFQPLYNSYHQRKRLLTKLSPLLSLSSLPPLPSSAYWIYGWRIKVSLPSGLTHTIYLSSNTQHNQSYLPIPGAWKLSYQKDYSPRGMLGAGPENIASKHNRIVYHCLLIRDHRVLCRSIIPHSAEEAHCLSSIQMSYTSVLPNLNG